MSVRVTMGMVIVMRMGEDGGRLHGARVSSSAAHTFGKKGEPEASYVPE